MVRFPRQSNYRYQLWKSFFFYRIHIPFTFITRFSFSVVGVGVFFYLKIPDIVRSFPGKMTDKGLIMCI